MTANALGAPRLPFATDEANGLVVAMVTGEDRLASVTQEQMLNGANAALVLKANGEPEIVQFWDVIPNPDGTFILRSLPWLILQHRAVVERDLRALREELATYKVHVASTYVPNDHLRVMEERLIDRLGAIERKLDRMIERRLAETDPL